MAVDRAALVLAGRQIGIRMEQLADRMLEPTGLSAVQAHLLLYVLRHDGQEAALTALHRQHGSSMAALSSGFKRLRAGGYIEAETCPLDNRRKRLRATPRARQLGAQLEQALNRGCETAYRGFTEEELKQLEQLQQRVLQNLAQPGNV